MIATVRSFEPEAEGAQPPYDFPAYSSTHKRAPKRPPIHVAHSLSEITGPSFGENWSEPGASDLTHQGKGEPIGERVILEGRVIDGDGRPLRGTLLEVWQANSAGRYTHERDQHDAPLDPNFRGAGHVITDENGGFRFLTIKPGAYPWRNAYNAWRPAHVHFSVFGAGFASRLITQMYFPGDPLLALDPIYNSIPDPAARERLISRYDPELSQEEYALGYRFDIVLRGPRATPLENRT
ncbi:MAG: protocatechuate 3,4-dioxygenase subunit beta [Candidatus Eremiobacteraeota bacterium]|nr:protocatechuate 3,4-dioxygenase subunit beta [Candidatus Eremiobacteraeota bacterium]